MAEILYKHESYQIIGACIEVHKNLDAGFLESIYAEALEMEFKKAEIPCEREKKLRVFFRTDFVRFNSIILELKATKYLVDAERQQTLNNVKATKFKLGLLINFGIPSLTYKRIVN